MPPLAYDLAKLAPPFPFFPFGEPPSFPLHAMNPYFDLGDLERHPKGVDYAHLLEGMREYPLIVDSNDDVLSFPLINGAIHRYNKLETFSLTSPTGKRACEASLMLVCLQLAQRGGTVHSSEISTCDDETITPVAMGKQHAVLKNWLSNFWDARLRMKNFTAIQRMGGHFDGVGAPADAPPRSNHGGRPCWFKRTLVHHAPLEV